jgi:hypothetical protein
MASKRVGIWITFCLIIGLTACDEPAELPTPLPVAIIPTTPAPTETFLPPTLDLTATAEAPATVTVVATLAATPAPTSTPTPIQPAINITSPGENTDLVMGSDIIAHGLVQLEANQTVWLSLISYRGQQLSEAPGAVGETGWESGINIPQNVSGAAFLQASIRDINGEIVTQNEIPVHLSLDAATTDRYLSLFRPQPGDPAMAGFNLFFDGRAQLPVNNVVTISVWADSCRTQVARQSFVLNGSGYWQGFVIIPQNVSGPGCAIAHFGSPGEESWREVQIPVDIAAIDDPSSKGVRIGNPPPNSRATAGQQLLLYGTALNVSDASVQLTILLENGRIITQNLIPTDDWGYWEYLVTFPLDVDGPAAITVSAGESGEADYAEDQILINIDAAPTPSP